MIAGEVASEPDAEAISQWFARKVGQYLNVSSETIDVDTPLADYGLDSLALAELLFTVEEHFNIDLPDDRSDVKTLAGLAGLIDELKPAAS